MSMYYDKDMLSEFFRRDVNIICRDKEEFHRLMNFFEYEYENSVLWNGGKLPTEAINIVDRDYDNMAKLGDVVIRIISSKYDGKLLYGVYEVTDRKITCGRNVYALDIICYEPVNINVNDLTVFLGEN